MLETLIIYVGAATAKAVAKYALRDSEALAAPGGDLAGLLVAGIPGLIERRRARSLFDRVAEEVATKLEPLYDVEFSGLDEGEREATARAVADTIDRTPLDISLLIEHNLDPLLLERTLRTHVPDAASASHLSDAATQLYDITLREVCNYISELVVTLPSFTEQAVAELLRRENDLHVWVRRVLAELPSVAGNLSAAGGSGARFEDQYRKEVARVLDRLALFGLGGSEAIHRYALSVAYISLTATTVAGDEASEPTKATAADRDAPSDEPRADGGSDDEAYVRVDQALASTPRAVIRGEAGSGKTTLLQWLAVNSARGTFAAHLDDLNGTVPFLIQLRRYGDDPLPTPPQFIDHTARNLAGILPAGWVEQKLQDGEALVLIDGVDEVPEERRQAVQEWIVSLCSLFPESRYVVTSRPPALDNRWLLSEGFSHSELQPMDVTDIDAFIDHWHRAAHAELSDEAERNELSALSEKLKRDVKASRSVRGLATSPLLCAVLCTLNRARRAKLPRDRIELYRFALELLLERRDIERDISDPQLAELTLRQKQALTQDLAFWLLLNGQTDVDKSTALDLIGAKLGDLGDQAIDPSEVFRFLLVRSGLLREPVEGRIDFLHRTFQEYLAAEEALDRNHIGVLLHNAHRDDWREVIVLAAGIARADQREKLLRGLLDLGSASPPLRHKLHLLAVACLETAPVLPPTLRQEIEQCLTVLVPPTTMSEARALASAGDLAVPLLSGFAHHKVGVAKACVRALGLVSSPAALTALERYSRDPRVTVARELINVWSYFNTDEFAERVLADSPLIHGTLTVNDAERLPSVRHLNELTQLRIEMRTDPVDMIQVAASGALTELYLERVSVSDLGPLADHRRLRTVSLVDCRLIDELEPLASTPVHSLTVAGATAISDFAPMGTTTLDRLTVAQVPGVDVASVGRVRSLRHLGLMRCGVHDVEPLGALENLEFVRLDGNRELQDIGALRGCAGMRSANLADTAVTNLAPAAAWPDLIALSADGSDVEHLDHLSSCASLHNLQLIRCRRLADVSGLAGLPTLTNLDLEGCSALEDAEPLAELSSLRWLDVSRTGIQNVSPLASLTSLVTIVAYGLDEDAVAWLQAALPNTHVLATGLWKY